MNGFERSKHQLNVGGAPQHRVEDLGKDLMGLFGSVEQGVNTYVKIGEQAASIDARDKIINATNEITLLKQELVKYEEANDTQGILNVKEGISRIVTEVKSYGDENSGEYAANIPARNKYNAIVNEWGASTLSTWMPTLDQKWIGAYKSKKLEEVQLGLNAHLDANIPVNEEWIKSEVDELRAAGVNDKFIDGVVNSMRTHNLNNIVGEITNNPNQFVKYIAGENGLLPINDGKKNILDAYFSGFTINKNGNVVTKEGIYATQENITAIEKTLGGLYATFTKDDSVYNAEAQVWLDELGKRRSAVENLDSDFSDYVESKEMKNLINVYNEHPETLSKGQINQITKIQFEASATRSKLIDVQLKGLNAIRSVAEFNKFIQGHNGVPAPIAQKWIAKQIKDVEDDITSSVQGNVDANIIAQKIENASKLYKVINKSEYPEVFKTANDIFNGTKYVGNYAEMKKQLEIFNQSVSIGIGVSNIAEQNKLASSSQYIYNRMVNAYDDAKAKGLTDKEAETKALSVMTKARIDKNQDETALVVNNVNIIDRTDPKKFNSFFNLGDTVEFPFSTMQYIANDAARKGIRFRDNDDAIDFINDQYERKSSTPFAPAIMYPKELESKINAMINSTKDKGGIKKINTNFPTIVIPKRNIDGTTEYELRVYTSKERYTDQTFTRQDIDKLTGEE